MTVSFRTRLFAVAALIVGAVLTTVITLGWSSVMKVEIERLDDRLCMEARRIATEPFHPDELPRLEADVALKLRLGSAEQLMLRFDPADGGPGFVSTRWNGAPLPEDLAWSASRRMEGLAPPPRRPQEELPDGLQSIAAPARPAPGACSLASFTGQASEWRAARFDLPFGRSVVAANLAAMKSELQGTVARALTIVVPLALMLTALGAWLLASLSLRPVNRLRDAMKTVTQQVLDQRLPSDGEDREFKALIGDYNTMLARLEVSFHQASRFSADAAHELKTPLTILQGRLERAIGRADNRIAPSELTGMLDEVGRLAAITRKLLLLSQADAGQLALHTTPVDVTELLDALVADAHMLIASQTISAAIARGLVACGDSALLRQLLNNLLSNAMRYSLPIGVIHIEGRALPGGVEVVFANPTVPIAAVHRARFFERFFRGDSAHNRAVEGSGLGLSLSRELARAHGGDLTLEPSQADEVRMRLWLPQWRTGSIELSVGQ